MTPAARGAAAEDEPDGGVGEPASEAANVGGDVEKVGGGLEGRRIDEAVVEVGGGENVELVANAVQRELVGVDVARTVGVREVDVDVRLVEEVETLLPLVLVEIVRVVRIEFVVVVQEHDFATHILQNGVVISELRLDRRAHRLLFRVDFHREKHEIRLNNKNKQKKKRRGLKWNSKYPRFPSIRPPSRYSAPQTA